MRTIMTIICTYHILCCLSQFLSGILSSCEILIMEYIDYVSTTFSLLKTMLIMLQSGTLSSCPCLLSSRAMVRSTRSHMCHSSAIFDSLVIESARTVPSSTMSCHQFLLTHIGKICCWSRSSKERGSLSISSLARRDGSD